MTRTFGLVVACCAVATLLTVQLAQAQSSQPAPSSAPTQEPAASSRQSPPASQPSGADDPFFSGDFDNAFDNVDTEWRDDSEAEQAAAAFVGPPSSYSRLRKLLKHDVLNILIKSRLLLSVQEIQDTRSDGFELLQLRAAVSGRFDNGFSYYTQVESTRSPAVVDAVVSYHPIETIGVSIGRMKVPFSGEYLITRPDLSFVDRSEIVLATAPNRGVGVQLSGSAFDRRLNYRAGAYNGAGMLQLDWGRNLLGAARVVGTPLRLHLRSYEIRLDLGVNVAYGWREGLALDASPVFAAHPGFFGTRALVGADLRAQAGPIWLAGEAIYGVYTTDPALAQQSFATVGGYGELGAALVPRVVDVMVRYDALTVDPDGVFNQFIIGGARVYVAEYFRVQLNYAWGFGADGSDPRGMYWSRNQMVAAFQMLL